MATKFKVRTPEGVKTVGLSDVRPYWLYDTITVLLAAGAKEDYFFRTPEGKTLRDTNLKQFSTIQVGWTFEVSAMRLIPNAATPAADLEELFGTGQAIVSFLREGDIEIFTVPAIMLNAGCGLYGSLDSGGTLATSRDLVSLGIPASGAVMKIPIKFLLFGGETFNFRFQATTTGALSANLKLNLTLEGVLKRGVRGA